VSLVRSNPLTIQTIFALVQVDIARFGDWLDGLLVAVSGLLLLELCIAQMMSEAHSDITLASLECDKRLD
jgi:hypothetical protein